jgi:hypothetical protein
MNGFVGDDVIGSNWICELSWRRRTFGVRREDARLLPIGVLVTAGDDVLTAGDLDLRVTLEILNGDSFTRGVRAFLTGFMTLVSDS